MDKEQKKALRAQYNARKPEMGIVCWESGTTMWIAISRDTKADHNSSLFQLQLGSWPNREMQAAFTEDPGAFEWSVLKKLDHGDGEEDPGEELELLYMLCMEEHPDARQMRPGRR